MYVSSPKFFYSDTLIRFLSVPDPELAAATGLDFFYKLLRGEGVSWESETHVRLGLDRLSYITLQALKDIAGARAGKRLENTKDHRRLARTYTVLYNF